MTAPRPRLPRRYVKPELVAHGGMGDVYRATDETLGRTVAIKVLAERYAADDGFHARFMREAKTAASLSGEPHVISIHDVGENREGLPFIVMEYAPDGTVADRLENGPVPPAQALEWLDQAADALDRAHARGIVHRDVKPANLLLAHDGGLRVSDFGIARAAGNDTLTGVGTVLGSSGYMAPEQARGEESTAATDRYALACVAFELLTGKRPFERDSQAAEAAAHATETPPSVASFDPALPAGLDQVFARGLAKVPDLRHDSARELASELRRVLQEPVTMVAAAPTGGDTRTNGDPAPVARYAAPPRRGARALAVGGLLVAGAVAGWAIAAMGDGSEATSKLPVTITSTVTVDTGTSTTSPPPPSPPPPPPPATPAPSSESGSELNDRGFRLLQQGDARGALPLLESAVAKLRGTSSRTEAYASYNLAWARFSLGRCDGVADLLDRSQEVQGYRAEIERLRRDVDRRCNGGHGGDGED
jgi:serine/threonine-protein kinase